MRLSAFQALNVGRCVFQSTRLWICISSMRSVRKSRIDSFIWAMPASRPWVQTLVARKALSRVPAAASRSPTTPSDLPYIGELSITEPPASNSTFSTSARGCRSAGAGPTSKVCQVPQPITPSGSPLDVMARVCMRGNGLGAALCACSGATASCAATAAPRRRKRARWMLAGSPCSLGQVFMCAPGVGFGIAACRLRRGAGRCHC
jgi:hypothetical protein